MLQAVTNPKAEKETYLFLNFSRRCVLYLKLEFSPDELQVQAENREKQSEMNNHVKFMGEI